jgi:hypothetical protein
VLTQDGFLKGPAIGTVNGRVGYRWKDGGWKLQLDVFNMFNSRSQQITYGYGSFIPTDALFQACNGALNAPTTDTICGLGQMGVHGHPIERTSWRLTFGGPLDFDRTSKLPDLTEPFQLVKFWEQCERRPLTQSPFKAASQRKSAIGGSGRQRSLRRIAQLRVDRAIRNLPYWH